MNFLISPRTVVMWRLSIGVGASTANAQIVPHSSGLNGHVKDKDQDRFEVAYVDLKLCQRQLK